MDCYVTLPIDVIKPNPGNGRTHSKKQIQQTVRSIREFGFATPVLVDESYMLIAGHGRIAAARMLGQWRPCPHWFCQACLRPGSGR